MADVPDDVTVQELFRTLERFMYDTTRKLDKIEEHLDNRVVSMDRFASLESRVRGLENETETRDAHDRSRSALMWSSLAGAAVGAIALVAATILTFVK